MFAGYWAGRADCAQYRHDPQDNYYGEKVCYMLGFVSKPLPLRPRSYGPIPYHKAFERSFMSSTQ